MYKSALDLYVYNPGIYKKKTKVVREKLYNECSRLNQPRVVLH